MDSWEEEVVRPEVGGVDIMTEVKSVNRTLMEEAKRRKGESY